MTEWDAAGYAHISSLQKAMAEQVLALLDLKGSERILDAGCREGKITAQIEERSPHGAVVVVDPAFAPIGAESESKIAATPELGALVSKN